jgi:PEP-CTERM motif-containing protein
VARIHLTAITCCSITMLIQSTMTAASLSASVDTFFETDGVIDCLHLSGGGPGTVNAPLVGCLQTFGQSSFQSAGAANAAFGTLRALGSISYTNLSVPSGDFEINWFVRADADMTDTLTIPKGSFFDVTINFSGSESNAGAFFFIDGATVLYSFPGSTTFRVPFKAGVPFEFSELLRVDLEGRLTPDQPQGRSFSQFVDLSHTVQIVSTQVLDSQGNPITGDTITSESGFDYNNPLGAGVAIPEPTSTGLMLAGLALVGSALIRRHRASR